jgi:hypothetical protein
MARGLVLYSGVTKSPVSTGHLLSTNGEPPTECMVGTTTPPVALNQLGTVNSSSTR